MHRLIRHLHMQRLRVRVRIDGNGGDAHLLRGLDDTAGDFAAVGDQDLIEHGLSFWVLRKTEKPRMQHSAARGRYFDMVTRCRGRQHCRSD